MGLLGTLIWGLVMLITQIQNILRALGTLELWIDRLLQDPAFVDKVRTRFAYYKDNEDYILGKIDHYAEKLKWSQKENNDKWELFGEYVWPNPVYFDTQAEEVAHLKSWYQSRMDLAGNSA